MKLICDVCGSAIKINQKNRSTIDPTSKNFCSKDCLLGLIRMCHPIPQSELILNYPDTGNIWSVELRRFFRSSYEVEVAKFLDESDIEYEYEQYLFPIKNTVYIPDFFLPEYGCFLEVKGRFGIGSKEKLKVFREVYDYSLITIPWHRRGLFEL